jgi:hypothetical protein
VISPLDAGVICWAGLSRGAITLALGYHHFSGGRTQSGEPDRDGQVGVGTKWLRKGLAGRHRDGIEVFKMCAQR